MARSRPPSVTRGGSRLERDGSVMMWRGGLKNADYLRDVIWVRTTHWREAPALYGSASIDKFCAKRKIWSDEFLARSAKNSSMPNLKSLSCLV